ncbi:ribonuclease III [Candidatus Saccharibacteria bacterium]|nr:ribonuclease III [Candidatus Saccharibacteria bacterium]MBI3338026.1 ribonuclease III [Candidatus Saccharibacteria bacterium]
MYLAFARDKLGVTFNNIELLITAFTHRSYVNEHRKTVKEHNERLEFLGDAVLELVVTEYLFNNFIDPEGTLTNWRSALVRTESISAAATRHEFEPLLRLSRGEKRGTSRARAQILANCYESVIGAIYIDQGYEAAKRFIKDSLLTTFKDILETGSWMDPKSHLQELAQSQENATPVYKVLEEEGPDHEKLFSVGVYVDGKLKGEGQGPSKQAGQVAAAEAALLTYK